MKLKWLPLGLIAWLANTFVRGIIKTSQLNVVGLENLTSKKDRKQIVMLWHNRLTIAPHLLNQLTPEIQYAAVVSSSKDGQLLAKMVGRFSNGTVIKVPHDLRHEALRQMVKVLKEKEVVPVITPDGPRGPRYTIKGGVALAAKEANALIIPMSWNADKFWEFGTWDRMRLPKPFSRITLVFGEPVDLKDDSSESSLDKLKHSLNGLSNIHECNVINK